MRLGIWVGLALALAIPHLAAAQVVYRSPGTAHYDVKNAQGTVVHRVLVGSTKGYNSQQYGAGYQRAKGIANAIGNRTGQGATVEFINPWGRGR
jgi:hypothetical protein